jgi:hypothetical protein
MQVTTIKVSIEGYGIWGSMEAEISPEENPIDEWIKLKEMVQLAMNQSDAMKGTVVTQVNPKNDTDKRVEEIIKDIESCPVIDHKSMLGVQVGLLAYESVANSDPRIMIAYDLKFKELLKG